MISIGVAKAGPIGSDSGYFNSHWDFEGLGSSFIETPAHLYGDSSVTFDSKSGKLRTLYSEVCKGSGLTGNCIGTDAEADYIDILFDSPTYSAGIFVGISGSWSAEVSFYEMGTEDLLGSMALSGKDEMHFAGWRAAPEFRIGRMRITDTALDGKVLFVDDLKLEYPVLGVSEPSFFMLLLMGMIGLSFLKMRKH